MGQILVIPSIDIKDGKTVRVVRGIPELNCKSYGNDAVEMAMIWRSENAKIIHVVDFDSVLYHSRKNFPVIEEICGSVVIPVEMGGGIRTFQDAKQAFELGVYRIVIGSLIHKDFDEFKKIFEHFGPQLVVAAIDVYESSIITNGRRDLIDVRPSDFAIKLAEIGLERIIVTDVKSNGTFGGPNLSLASRIAEKSGLKITVSGGLRGYRDLIKVQQNAGLGIDSVIVGRALYENKFPCQKIWRIEESNFFSKDE